MQGRTNGGGQGLEGKEMRRQHSYKTRKLETWKKNEV
jgi:hypothetical protein